MAQSGRTGGSRATGGAKSGAKAGGKGGAAKAGGRPTGSVRSTSRKGPSVGTGGHNKRRLEGRGPTPPAEQRTGHPKARAAAAAARAAAGGGTRPSPSSRTTGREAARNASGRPPATRSAVADSELVTGRNAVLEALRAKVPAVELLVAEGVDIEQRLTESLALARKRGLTITEIPRRSMDRLASEGVHQGVVLRVPPYEYRHPGDLLTAATEAPEPALLVALDGVTDPHNLGSVARSAAALGGHGVVVPERRAAGVTATAWKASAGALARLPVARATNLARTLKTYSDAGLVVVGLAADGELDLDDLELATEPLVLVIGSEGKGLSRLVSDMCTVRLRIPMAGPVESLNAGVAAGVALAEIARRRRLAAPDS